MKNDFDSLYEKFDELYTTYDDRKALKGYIESMSRKSSKEEVEVSADNLPDTILTFEEFKTILPAINKKKRSWLLIYLIFLVLLTKMACLIWLKHV